MTKLFKTRDGKWVTDLDVAAALHAVGAAEAKVLYMHTELSFGTPNPGLGRSELLAHLFEIVMGLKVPTLCVPTFTFSFCNGEDYDVKRSRSRMGVFNEYIRQLQGTLRSVDPLMSVALTGEDLDLVSNLGHRSIGADSTFDKLHRREGAKFLFFGASPSKCFTYSHYVEEREGVYYRYNRDFTGTIVDSEGRREDTYTLFVRYRNVTPSSEGILEKEMLRTGILRCAPCGDTVISTVDEPAAYETIAGQLRADINCYLAKPYPGDHLDREFVARNMVAL
ncbi:MAG: AAC(3) family N-acetyltransferase [Deltaproteobacteria bacterium]|nr:AAC(3) family N-acetyltransferase [Deltaproteobacteria bacterium]